MGHFCVSSVERTRLGCLQTENSTASFRTLLEVNEATDFKIGAKRSFVD